jgi:SAM-dependent methyltransferase
MPVGSHGDAASNVDAAGHQQVWDLENLASATRLVDWMSAQFIGSAHGAVAEVGAGVGTFSARLLDAGATSLLLIEPDERCAAVLAERFGGDLRVCLAREELPEAGSLLERRETFDFVLCQNVLEHVPDDARSVHVMADALRPGGRLTLLVPAGPSLFGSLDRTYGHERRYTRESLRAVVERGGLRITDLYSFNALGIPGWWLKNLVGGTSVDSRLLRLYEAVLPLWRPVEERFRLPWGLSLIAHAQRPEAGADRG